MRLWNKIEFDFIIQILIDLYDPLRKGKNIGDILIWCRKTSSTLYVMPLVSF